MTVDLIYWALLAALGGWCGRQQWWIAQHHKSCHSEPLVKAAELEQRVAACERECKRNSTNWHRLRRQVSPLYLWVQYLLEKLGIKVTVLPEPAEDADEGDEPPVAGPPT